MRTTYITSIVIAILIGAWLLSGQLGQPDAEFPDSIADQNREQARVDEDLAPTQVRVQVIDASEQARFIRVRGRTENKRTVVAKMELSGTVIERPVERGTIVAQGDLLCRLSVEDRQVAMVEARAALDQARIEYQGALSLKEKGFNSQTAIAGAKARLASAQANLDRRQLDMRKIRVSAPFDGIVEDVHQEVGDFVSPGASCATIVDLDPMLLRGRVSEQEVMQLSLGQQASGVLRNGVSVTGPVSFIGQQSDPNTRTYALEIEVPNPTGSLRSGITTEILIPVQQVMAQKVSPALFSLSDEGDIGIRTINADNVVEYHRVQLLADAEDGVWVTGLPNRAAVITVGQELVTAGERIDPIFQGQNTLKATTLKATSDDPAQTPSPTVDPGPPNAGAVTALPGATLGAN